MMTKQLKGWRRYPKVAAFVNGALGNSYRKQRVLVRGGDSVTLCDLQWSGGTKNEYHAFTCCETAIGWVPTGVKRLDGPEGKSVPVLDHCAIACSGWFCGKESTFLLVVRDADMLDLLGDAAVAALEEFA